MGKFQVLTVLGAVFPHFSIGKRKIWHPRGPLSKRNTGMLTCGIIKQIVHGTTNLAPLRIARTVTWRIY